MPRIAIPKREDAPADSKPILDNVDKLLGFVPNLHRLMSISPNALAGWAALMGSLAKTLDVKTRDGIALAVSEADGCDYCLAAHSFMAGNLAKIPADEIELNREGRSSDPKRQAAVAFAKALIETRGKVSDAQFAAVRDAGWTDANIVEMIALTAQFLLTNFMNNAVQTPIDFPAVSPAKAVNARCPPLERGGLENPMSRRFPRLGVKRVYEPREASDGMRVLVDRIWPRGLTKEHASVDVWLKDIAPSAGLRTWFGHDPDRWREFHKRYLEELRANHAAVDHLMDLVSVGKVTLLFGARDVERNNAVALADYLAAD